MKERAHIRRAFCDMSHILFSRKVNGECCAYWSSCRARTWRRAASVCICSNENSHRTADALNCDWSTMMRTDLRQFSLRYRSGGQDFQRKPPNGGGGRKRKSQPTETWFKAESTSQGTVFRSECRLVSSKSHPTNAF